MKIWQGYGSEHSANLVIIGHFSSPADAAAARDLIETAMRIAADDERAGRIVAGSMPSDFSPAMGDFVIENSLPFSYADAEGLLYDHRVNVEGSDVVITTEDVVINGLMNMLIHQGARVETYSAHRHPSEYGRPTYEG
jgi:hypothetical protein